MKLVISLISCFLVVGIWSGCTRERLDTFQLKNIRPDTVIITSEITNGHIRTNSLLDSRVVVTDTSSIRELLSQISDCGPKSEIIKMYSKVKIEFEIDSKDYWFGFNTDCIKHKSGCYRLADPEKLIAYLKSLGVDIEKKRA